MTEPGTVTCPQCAGLGFVEIPDPAPDTLAGEPCTLCGGAREISAAKRLQWRRSQRPPPPEGP